MKIFSDVYIYTTRIYIGNMGYAEMPTFKNQMQVKCKLNIAEWVTSWGLAGSKVGSKVKGPVSLHSSDLSTVL